MRRSAPTRAGAASDRQHLRRRKKPEPGTLGARIAAVDNGLRRQFDIWLTYHPDANKILRFRWLIGWLIESFDPKRFPWFKDEFTIPTSC
jgi:hypothetical protein